MPCSQTLQAAPTRRAKNRPGEHRHNKVENSGSNKYLLTSVESSSIHSSQKAETTQMPIKGRTEERLWSIHVMEQFCHKRNDILTHTTCR